MTIGRPGSPGTPARWLRERLLGLGLTEDQVVATLLPTPPRLGKHDLEPASFVPDFAPLIGRVERLLGGGRRLSIYVTGNRSETSARQHAALQIALGLTAKGREVTIVDADFLKPGLGGLVSDPLADGLTDLVRFGRAARPLLLRPVSQGPWLLPAGSFPEDEPLPLEPDALRSGVYRISQVCEVALYVGPLELRSELHPLIRICDHVVHAAVEDSVESGIACAEAVRKLQALGAHLLGVVTHFVPAPFTEATRERPRPATPPRFGSGAPDAPTSGAPREVEPPKRPFEPEPEPEVEFETEIEVDLHPEKPTVARWLPPIDLPELGEREQPERTGRDDAFEPERAEEDAFTHERDKESERERRALAARIATSRSTGDRSDVGPDRREPLGEFAFEEERGGHGSALLVIALLVVTVGFLVVLGPRLLDRWRESRAPAASTEHQTLPSSQMGETEVAGSPAAAPETSTEPPPPTPSEPDDRAAATSSEPAVTTPDDRAAAQPGASATPTSPPPAETPASTPPEPARSEAPASAPSGPAVTSPAEEGYGVHLASYRTVGRAQVEIATLKRFGYPAGMQRTDLGERGVWYRVYAGPYATRPAADRARAAILQLPEYKYAQVRRVPRD